MTEGDEERVFAIDEILQRRPSTYEDMAGTILYLVGKPEAYCNSNVSVLGSGRLTVMPGTY